MLRGIYFFLFVFFSAGGGQLNKSISACHDDSYRFALSLAGFTNCFSGNSCSSKELLT